MRILNLAAGKFSPLSLSAYNMTVAAPNYVLNVDTSYFIDTSAADIELDIEEWEKNFDRTSKSAWLNMDVFEFMERTKLTFDRVVIYRFLEHVSFTQVDYFIYLVSTVLNSGGIVDVIVPNYKILAEMIRNEDQYITKPEYNFQRHNILLTTELLNEPSCPHASIWTDTRMRKMWELEKRFIVTKQNQAFEFDGRRIYLRSIIERV